MEISTETNAHLLYDDIAFAGDELFSILDQLLKISGMDHCGQRENLARNPSGKLLKTEFKIAFITLFQKFGSRICHW